jgi:hypothetical protein
MDDDFFAEELFKHKLDPLFSSRRRPTDADIEEIVGRFVEERLSVAEAEAAIERLSRAKGRVLPRLLSMAASPRPRMHQTAATLLRIMNLTKAIKPLRKLLEDPDLDDEHKMSILHVLHALGGLEPDENPFVYLRDPEGMFQKSQEAILNSLQDPLHLEAALQTIVEGETPIRDNPALLSAMAFEQDRRVLPLLLCLLHSPDDRVVNEAIEALSILEDPTTVSILEERARYDPSRKVRKAAREAAARLGPQPTDLGPASIFDLPIAPPPLVRCLISTIDGSGGQILVIIRRDPEVENRYLFWDLMFNDHEGIKDCFGGQSYADEQIEEMIVEGLSEIGIETVSISLERARVEIDRAYQITLKAKRRLPITYMGWQAWLQGEDAPPFQVFPLPEIAAKERAALLERCHELADLDEFESWFFAPEELRGLEHNFEQLAQWSGADEEIEALISQGIRTIVDPHCRRRLRERLQRQAWLLAQIYEEEDIPKLALAAAAGLADDAGLHPEDHPLLREMMFDSLFHAAGSEDDEE